MESYRAPMRSRRDDVEASLAVERALALGLCGIGGRLERIPRDLRDALDLTAREHDERTARRLERFAAVPEGSTVWTRDPDGRFVAGTLSGPWRYDTEPAAYAADLVHVRACAWGEPREEHRTPAAVVATFRRGGRNFQRITALDVV
ncbi:GAF domain-containing protein [Nocardioides sp. KIGAM211]|uniref:GAF domain-containing protein n=1 Tax=Nocardioides luti TaxID=2761101 RepID=A0A7X0VCS9_9ACTN|nr:GAF domain-containing protein [Nocardioides luti]MBB6629367.1 GAF domain-containing protein [Nocardioides luti]